MKFKDKLLITLGAITVGVILDIISLLFNYDSLFGLGMLIVAIGLFLICIIIYIELQKYKSD